MIITELLRNLAVNKDGDLCAYNNAKQEFKVIAVDVSRYGVAIMYILI